MCPDAVNNVQLVDCVAGLAREARRRLDAAEAVVRGNLPGPARRSFDVAARLWQSHTETYCDLRASLLGGASARPYAAELCLKANAEARALFLATFYPVASPAPG
jgi:hypothetical protein